MRLLVVDHPLVTHKLTILRAASTDVPTFRRVTEEVVTLLAYEATRDTPVQPIDIRTPVAPARGVRLSPPPPLLVPILRAGLGMLEGFARLLPSAEVGFLGMIRDEQTLLPSIYAHRLPETLQARRCFLLDPMLATGGSMAAAVRLLVDRGAEHITAICLLAAPEGLEALEQHTARLAVRLNVVAAAVDERLDERSFIVPGLGDAGDRLYGPVA